MSRSGRGRSTGIPGHGHVSACLREPGQVFRFPAVRAKHPPPSVTLAGRPVSPGGRDIPGTSHLAQQSPRPPSMGLFRDSSWGYFPTADLATGLRPASLGFHTSPLGIGRLPAHAWARDWIKPKSFRFEPAPRARVGEGWCQILGSDTEHSSPRTRGREGVSCDVTTREAQLPAHAWARRCNDCRTHRGVRVGR